jgi:hypothetical protein
MPNAVPHTEQGTSLSTQLIWAQRKIEELEETIELLAKCHSETVRELEDTRSQLVQEKLYGGCR